MAAVSLKLGRGARLAASWPSPIACRYATAVDIEDFIERHRATWLRDAEATLTVLDWRAFTDGRTFHVLDSRDLGAPRRGYFGFATQAQLHEIAAHVLPFKPSTRPAAAVAVNVDALVSCLRISLTTEADEGVAFDTIRAAVAAVAAHELAHVVDAQAAGRRLAEGTTLEAMVQSIADGSAYARRKHGTAHGPGWVRAYAHFLTRAAFLRGYDQWIAAFRRDVKAVLPHHPDDYLDALHPELVRHTADDPLVEVIRTPASAGFLKLFDRRDAARSATEET